jgi:hypothetical protein
MGRRKPGRPRKSVEEKRERKTATQRHRREGKRMAREQGDAIYSFHSVESDSGDSPRDRDSAGECENR